MLTDTTPTTTLVEGYLERLRVASADLPHGPRAELLDQIAAHVAETVPPGADETAVRRVLDDLGTPEAVAAAARAEAGSDAPADGRETGRLYDVGTVLVLLLGAFVVPVLGWVAGVIMLWSGPRWTRAEKVVGTLLAPAALTVAVAVLAAGGGLVTIAVTAVTAVLVGAGAVAGHVVLLRRARVRA